MITLFTFDTGTWERNTSKLFRMPGGEWHINGDLLNGHELAYVQGASADDLLALSIWADAVHRDDGLAYAVIPYLPGARQDRRQQGEALSSKVYADLINSCGLETVVCLDPHSDVMPALIDRCVVVRPTGLVHLVLAENPKEQITGVLAPDAGAAKRAQAVATGREVAFYQATKRRDPTTGKLSRFQCPEDISQCERLLVVDDICDGGRTFLGLAEATGLPRERLALWVTHGVFSDGSEKIWDAYSTVFTTDSHTGSDPYNVETRREHRRHGKEIVMETLPHLLPYVTPRSLSCTSRTR